jgi:hypothetical protein
LRFDDEKIESVRGEIAEIKLRRQIEKVEEEKRRREGGGDSGYGGGSDGL